MAYDPKKEKVIKEETVEIDEGTKAIAKKYSYNGGEEKFKVIFEISDNKGNKFFTSKFPALASAKDAIKIARALEKIAK